MGLFLRVNAFRGVSHGDVHAALTEFWTRHDRRIEPVPLDADPLVDSFTLHEERDGWTVLHWTSGWEWTLRRQAQLHVSGILRCAGILVFVYDGDDWGYELFDQGAAVDWFVQYPQDGNTWFPGKDLSGRPEAIAAAFPHLGSDLSQIAPYLVQCPDDYERDAPARPGDRFSRCDGMAALDFLRLLGANVWSTPSWRRFTVEPPPEAD